MRSRFAALVAALGLLTALTAPGWACAFHDQQASAANQQTADAQQQQPTHTETR